ncbi:hypothetical protein AAY473_015545 [Plecturocebus cupreus]
MRSGWEPSQTVKFTVYDRIGIEGHLTSATTVCCGANAKESIHKMGFHHVDQAGLELPTSDGVLLYDRGWSAVPRSQLTEASTSWSQAIFLPQPPMSQAETTGTCHHTWLTLAVSLCRQAPGWSAVVRSRLTATSTFRVQAILPPQPPNRDESFSTLVRLVLNSQHQVIGPPRPPKVLGLQPLLQKNTPQNNSGQRPAHIFTQMHKHKPTKPAQVNIPRLLTRDKAGRRLSGQRTGKFSGGRSLQLRPRNRNSAAETAALALWHRISTLARRPSRIPPAAAGGPGPAGCEPWTPAVEC